MYDGMSKKMLKLLIQICYSRGIKELLFQFLDCLCKTVIKMQKGEFWDDILDLITYFGDKNSLVYLQNSECFGDILK